MYRTLSLWIFLLTLATAGVRAQDADTDKRVAELMKLADKAAEVGGGAACPCRNAL